MTEKGAQNPMLKDKINLETDQDSTDGLKAVAMVVMLHIGIAFLIGFIILFIGGLMKYMLWIIGGAAVVLIGSCWFFIDRLKKQSAELVDLMQSPVVQGRAFEVKLLGGVASIKVGAPDMAGMAGLQEIQARAIQLEQGAAGAAQLEDPETVKRRELEKLVEMRREELISAEEFEQLKAGLMKSGNPPSPVEPEATTIIAEPVDDEPDVQILP